VHNKLKPKIGSIPDSVKYFSGEDLGDVWVDYRQSKHIVEVFAADSGSAVAWEMTDIDQHDAIAAQQKQAKQNGQ
jgi:hypothetical protein